MSYRCRCTPRIACGLVLVAGVALVSPAVAAQDSALAPGAQIRIQGTDGKQLEEGTFRALTSDSLTYSPGLATSSQSIPLARVGRIEVSRYDLKARSVLTDAAIGSAVGLGGTLAIAGGCLVFHSDCGWGFILATPVLIGGGFLVGALIGSQHRSQHWDQVYPPERSASLLLGPAPRGGVLMGVSIPFGGASTR